jgi:hypothetical protein
MVTCYSTVLRWGRISWGLALFDLSASIVCTWILLCAKYKFLGEFLGIFYAYFEHFECIYMRIFLGFSCAYIPFFINKGWMNEYMAAAFSLLWLGARMKMNEEEADDDGAMQYAMQMQCSCSCFYNTRWEWDDAMRWSKSVFLLPPIQGMNGCKTVMSDGGYWPSYLLLLALHIFYVCMYVYIGIYVCSIFSVMHFWTQNMLLLLTCTNY